jgi:hypothetical protein
MKIRIWNVIVNNGDGSSSSILYRNKQEIIDDFDIPEEDHDEVCDGGCPFPEGDDIPLEISVEIFDTDGYEVVG